MAHEAEVVFVYEKEPREPGDHFYLLVAYDAEGNEVGRKVGGMGITARSLLGGASFLAAGAMFGLIGYGIGQALQGSPAAPLALAVGLMAVSAVWGRIRTQR